MKLNARDKHLLQTATAFRKGVLDGRKSDCMCFAICAPLSTLLAMNGICVALDSCDISDDKVAVSNHYWLRLADGRVLDPTADQFNKYGEKFPAVYLGKPTKWHKPRPARGPHRRLL